MSLFPIARGLSQLCYNIDHGRRQELGRGTPGNERGGDHRVRGRDVLRSLWAHSLDPVIARRGADGFVRPILDADTRQAAHLRWEHGTARVLDTAPTSQTLSIELPATGVAALAAGMLSLPPNDPSIEVGRQLSGPGDFDDHDQTGVD